MLNATGETRSGGFEAPSGSSPNTGSLALILYLAKYGSVSAELCPNQKVKDTFDDCREHPIFQS